MKPLYLVETEVPESVLLKEKEILLEQLNEAQKAKADKILPGKVQKFYEDVVLMHQIFVKDETGKKTIKQLVDELSVRCGEKVQVRRFQRLEVGEGIARQVTDFAAEVAAVAGA